MKKILLLCSLLMISPTLMAEDTTTETCANGAGTIIAGAVTGTKYCMSNTNMNWWNAVSWCDALGKELLDLNTDCGCPNTQSCSLACPEVNWQKEMGLIWLKNVKSESTAYAVDCWGKFHYAGSQRQRLYSYRAVCK